MKGTGCGAVGAFSQTPEVWCCRCRKTAASNNQSGSDNTTSGSSNTQQSNASKQHSVQQGAKQGKAAGLRSKHGSSSSQAGKPATPALRWFSLLNM
jgi:hypothetical protein